MLDGEPSNLLLPPRLLPTYLGFAPRQLPEPGCILRDTYVLALCILRDSICCLVLHLLLGLLVQLHVLVV